MVAFTLVIQRMLTKEFIQFLKELCKEVSTDLSPRDIQLALENRIREDEIFVSRINQLLGD